MRVSMQRFAPLVMALSILGMVAGAKAQTTTPAQPPQPAGQGTAKPADQNSKSTQPDAKAPTPDLRSPNVGTPINIEEIPLSPGDQLQIQVENHPNMNGQFYVPSGGKLLLQEVGEVQVAGYTQKQVRDRLQKECEKTLNNVYVRVVVLEVHSRTALIDGDVAKPNIYDMGVNQWHLLDLIGRAGGRAAPLTRQGAGLNEYTCTLYHDKTSQIIDLVEAYKHPDGPANALIQPGDRVMIGLVSVETIRHEIHILGQIPRQGTYPFDSRTTIFTIFGQAGFPNPNTAALSKSYVERGNDQIALDLRPLMTGNVDPTVNNFKFKDEDILFIPEVKANFMVWGQVSHQGNFIYPEDGKMDLLKAITEAQAAPTANLKKVHLIRTVGGKKTDMEINVDEMERKGLLAKNMHLEPNDIIFVPPRHKIASTGEIIQDVFAPLSLMTLLGLHIY